MKENTMERIFDSDIFSFYHYCEDMCLGLKIIKCRDTLNLYFVGWNKKNFKPGKHNERKIKYDNANWALQEIFWRKDFMIVTKTYTLFAIYKSHSHDTAHK
jgi:hypothetical protein